MDSFYDAPRRPPPQISREKLSGEPVVPEISLLVPPNLPQNKFTPYSQWKRQQTNQNGLFIQNKENLTSNIPNSIQNNSILKKVRFENHHLAQTQDNNKNAYCILREHNINKPIPAKVEVPFEQMYMANIPSRQLDLSVIDIPKKPASPCLESQAQHTESKCKESPKTYREYLQSQKKCREEQKKIVLEDTVTDIFNYKRNIPDNSFGDRDPINPGTSMDVFKSREQSDKFIMKSTPDKVNYIDHVTSVRPDFVSQKNQVKELPQKENVNRVDHKNFYEPSPVIHKEVSLLASQKDGFYSYNKLAQKDTKNNTDIVYKNQSYETHNSPTFQQKIKYDFSPKTHNSQDAYCKCYCCVKPEKKSEKSDDNLSTSDLLKIISQQSQQIAQQNNQLMLLQQQVSELVSIHKNYEKDRQQFMLRGPQDENVIKCIERQPCCQHVYHEKVADHGNVQERYVTSTQHNVAEPDFFDLAKKNRNHRPNFSIGLTTSLEVSFRRPMTEAESQNNKVVYEYQPPKIQEVTETELTQSNVASENRHANSGEKNSFRETLIDTSMVFKEPIKVRETCPSPEPSININMNDFEDTDSDDESSQIGATFYRNLMAQVNKVLQKAQIDSMEKIVYDSPGSYLDNKTMHKVKEATLKHLKRIGVNLPNEGNIYSESLSEESAGVSYTQDDVSFAVKQLLMKYLPSDHLAKLASKKEHNKDELDLTPKQNIGAIKSRPEFSFASVQYMKKYNLIANSQKEFPGARRQADTQSPKILDITKLRQQPKLL